MKRLRPLGGLSTCFQKNQKLEDAPSDLPLLTVTQSDNGEVRRIRGMPHPATVNDHLNAAQTFIGAHGPTIAVAVAAMVAVVVLRAIIRTGRRAATKWVAVAALPSTGAIWAAARHILETKGWR